MNDPFYKKYQEKINQELPKGFDQRFFKKLDNANTAKKPFWNLKWISALSSACVILIIFLVKTNIDQKETKFNEMLALGQHAELLENLDIYVTIDELNLPEDLTEEEWDILLEGSNEAS
jgi:hypothetical protein